MEVNWIAVIAAAASAFIVGAVSYGPLFGKAWQSLSGLSDEQVNSGNMPMILGGSFVLSLIAAFVFAMFLGPNPGVQFATAAGLSASLCWVAASFGISYLFEQRPFKLWLINGGYHTLQFTLYGAILGWLWADARNRTGDSAFGCAGLWPVGPGARCCLGSDPDRAG